MTTMLAVDSHNFPHGLPAMYQQHYHARHHHDAEPSTEHQHQQQHHNGGGSRPVPDDCVNLFVNYLPLSVTDAELLQRFAPFGRVLSAKIMRHIDESATADAAAAAVDPSTMRSKGYGFVLMADRAEADAAIGELHASKWDTKRLVVQVAQRLPADAAVPVRQQPDAPRVAGRPALAASAAARKAAPSASATYPATGYHNVGQIALGAVRAHVDVSPVDPGCSLARLSAVLESYGPVESAQVLHHHPPHSAAATTVRVVFASVDAADEACRWLNAARVPQIAARTPLSVLRVSPQQSPQQSRNASRAASKRSTKLAPVGNGHDSHQRRGAASLSSSSSSYAMPPLSQQHPMPTTVAQHQQRSFMTHANSTSAHRGYAMPPAAAGPMCQHGPYCQCGVDSAAAAPTAYAKFSTRPSGRAQLGASAPSSGSSSHGSSTPPGPTPRKHSAMSSSGNGAKQRHDPYAMPPSAQQQFIGAGPSYGGYGNYAATAPSSFSGGCANGCHYCSNGTTVILANMPTEEEQCMRALDEVLGPIGYFRNQECWGNGQAVATFSDYHCAVEAVELLGAAEHAVDYYDCQTGLPASQGPHGARF